MTTKLLLLFWLAASCALMAAPPAPLTVAVFDFESRDDSIKDLGSKLATLVSASLSANGDWIVLERAELDKALGEQELGLSGAVTPASASRVGSLTGAKVLVAGRVMKVDKETMCVAKVIGTETGRVFGETIKLPTGELATAAETLAGKIGQTMTSRGDQLVSKQTTREERIAALVASKLARPVAVQVRLPEQHFGAPASDPAAQTELRSLLQRAGYEVVEEGSTKRPDLDISGEAFSAFGFRRANLVACRARIELTVRSTADGRIRFSGSQTSAAVDIAEQTAAKTALENAALDLAERLLPRLANE